MLLNAIQWTIVQKRVTETEWENIKPEKNIPISLQTITIDQLILAVSLMPVTSWAVLKRERICIEWMAIVIAIRIAWKIFIKMYVGRFNSSAMRKPSSDVDRKFDLTTMALFTLGFSKIVISHRRTLSREATLSHHRIRIRFIIIRVDACCVLKCLERNDSQSSILFRIYSPHNRFVRTYSKHSPREANIEYFQEEIGLPQGRHSMCAHQEFYYRWACVSISNILFMYHGILCAWVLAEHFRARFFLYLYWHIALNAKQ